MEQTTNYGLNVFSNPVDNYPNESIPGNWQALISENMKIIDECMNDLQRDIDQRLLQRELLDSIYPVGAIYMSISPANPGTFLGGVWEQWSNGRVAVGVDVSDNRFDEAERTGGNCEHTLDVANLPKHSHGMNNHTHVYSASISTGSAGDHSHSVNLSGTTGAESAHTHSVSVSGTAASAGEHRHAVNLQYNRDELESGSTKSQVTPSPTGNSYGASVYNTLYGGEHKHSVSVSGTTGKGSSHNHSFSASCTAISNGSHTHALTVSGTTSSAAGTTGIAGEGIPVNTMPPYITCFMWKRVG